MYVLIPCDLSYPKSYKCDSINSSHLKGCASRGMQVLDENSKFFLISLNSEMFYLWRYLIDLFLILGIIGIVKRI